MNSILNDEIKNKSIKKNIKTMSQPELTYQTRDLNYETMINSQKTNQNNYETYFPTNSMLNDETRKNQ